MPRFRAFRRIGLTSGAVAVARFDDEQRSPAIVTARSGRGDAVLFATTADDDWTDWPRSEAGRVTYVSLVQWLVEEGAPAARAELNVAGGSRIEFPLDPSAYRPEATLVPPDADGPHADGPHADGADARELTAAPDADRDGLWLVSDPLRKAGVWELRLSRLDGEHDIVYFAVNLPDEEGLLARTPPELLKAAQVRPGHLRVLSLGEGDVTGALAEAAAPARYWPIVAAVLLTVLMVESLLACAFGNPRGSGAGSRPRGGGRA